MLKAQQRGFTLIELVVVIVILGILAAFAVPRFMGMEGEARAAAIRSMGGTLMSAASMAHAKCQARGCGANGNVTIEGQTVTMTNGYPNRQTMDRTLQTTEGFQPSNQGNSRRYSKLGASTTNCWVQYNPPAAANTPPTLTWGIRDAGLTTAQPGTAQFNQVLADNC